MFGVEGFLIDVENEAARARRKFPAFHSTHEAYAVLLEEMDEFWQEVKRQSPDPDAMYRELVQVAAMALCAALECASPVNSMTSAEAAAVNRERAQDAEYVRRRRAGITTDDEDDS